MSDLKLKGDPAIQSTARKLTGLLRTEPRETLFRSVSKSLGYRVYSSLVVTPILSYAVTQSSSSALNISLGEMVVKPFTYLLFERTASHFGIGYKRNGGAQETEARSMTKAVSYRLYSSFVSSAIAFSVTHQLKYGLGMGAIELAVKPFTYYVFERAAAWYKRGYRQEEISAVSSSRRD